MTWLEAVFGKDKRTTPARPVETLEAVTFEHGKPEWAVTPTGLWASLGRDSLVRGGDALAVGEEPQ